jgi:hypothetical protein
MALQSRAGNFNTQVRAFNFTAAASAAVPATGSKTLNLTKAVLDFDPANVFTHMTITVHTGAASAITTKLQSVLPTGEVVQIAPTLVGDSTIIIGGGAAGVSAAANTNLLSVPGSFEHLRLLIANSAGSEDDVKVRLVAKAKGI